MIAYMQPHVDFETTCSRVPLITASESAGEGFLAGMSKLVSLQMALSDELVLAYAASEGTLTCVRPHVGLEVSCF